MQLAPDQPGPSPAVDAAADVHRDGAGVAALDLVARYATACVRHGNVRQNAALVMALAAPGVESLDFTNNLLGRRGLLPLLDVLAADAAAECHASGSRRLGRITSLCLRGNFLDNADVVVLTQGLRFTPQLRQLDLRDNPGISQAGGRLLLAMVSTAATSHPRLALQRVQLSGTNVSGCLQSRIDAAATANGEWWLAHQRRLAGGDETETAFRHAAATTPEATVNTASSTASAALTDAPMDSDARSPTPPRPNAALGALFVAAFQPTAVGPAAARDAHGSGDGDDDGDGNADGEVAVSRLSSLLLLADAA